MPQKFRVFCRGREGLPVDVMQHLYRVMDAQLPGGPAEHLEQHPSLGMPTPPEVIGQPAQPGYSFRDVRESVFAFFHCILSSIRIYGPARSLMRHTLICSIENVCMQTGRRSCIRSRSWQWLAVIRLRGAPRREEDSESFRPLLGCDDGVVRYERQFSGEESAEDQADRGACNYVGTEVRSAFDPRYADNGSEKVEDAPVFWKIL